MLLGSKSDEHDAGWNRRCSPPPLPKPILHLNHSDSKRSDKPTTHECLKQVRRILFIYS